ncbi:MAG: D-alanine--D-alanine ligase [Oscillospiraceae bacterium]|nr:D-alanine--D-alanine ligase [Oscillospiraceae bacterium]MCL2277972.1 D-alanine--D-alanine ligase [Oscillospiraceae bacterium]
MTQNSWLSSLGGDVDKTDKKQIAVVFGGFSPEYEVSLKSAFSVIGAINKEKYNIIMIGITKSGQWFRYYGSAEDIPTDRWHTQAEQLRHAFLLPERGGWILEFDGSEVPKSTKIDLVFPVLHGRYGEDGTVQGLCELAGVPFVGCGTAASALCMDKHRAHKVVEFAGVTVPKAVCFENAPTNDELEMVKQELKLPVFVKPVKAGSSIGVAKLERFGELKAAIDEAFLYDDAVIIEENIFGMEIGCSVVGNEELIVGKINEIEVDNGFFTYDEKYTLKNSRFYIPARIDEKTEKRVVDAAKIIFRVLGCRGYARMDMFIRENGEIVFNEANTIPGFTVHSQLPRMMAAAGYPYPELVEMLIKLGLKTPRGKWYGS